MAWPKGKSRGKPTEEHRARNSAGVKKWNIEHPGFQKEIQNRPEVKKKKRVFAVKQWKDLEYQEKQRIARLGNFNPLSR